MRNEAVAASSSATYTPDGRGAGGRLRRPFARKPPSTPYDRPLAQQRRSATTGSGRDWMSKIVNPAYRLIAGGAARLLPFVFSSSSTDSVPFPTSEAAEEGFERGTRNENQESSNHFMQANGETRVSPIELAKAYMGSTSRASEFDTGSISQVSKNDRLLSHTYEMSSNRFLPPPSPKPSLFMSEPTALEGPCEQEGRQGVTKSAVVGQGKSQHLAGDPDLSNIEQLIKGETFCREEIDHLMGILQSRIVDPEGRGLTSSANTAEKADKVEIPHGNLKSENEENQENLEEDRLASRTPLQQPKFMQANGETRVSPIELAKAYMGSTSRASEFDTGSISQVSKNDRLLSHTFEMPSNRFLPPPSPKPSVCWPGAILQEQHGYLTPYSQRGRSGFSNHPRTPYTRTIYSRSKSKLTPLDGDNINLSFSSTTPIQKKTPLYGESRVRAPEDVQGSVGPIRRLRHKFVSETPRRGSPSQWSSQKVSPQPKDSFPGDYSLAIKPIEPMAIGNSFQSPEQTGLSEAVTTLVHPQTSKLARQILEQISRTPTAKEKSDELKLVIAKKNYPISDVSATAIDAATASHVGGFRPDKEKESPFFKVTFSNLPTGGINGIDSDSTSASKTIQKSSLSTLINMPSTTNLVSTQAMEIPRPRGLVAPTSLPRARSQAGENAPTPSGTKPVLPPIFVDKSNQRVRFSSENCSSGGFTFPVAAGSSLSSEPPTPSMLPFSSSPPPTLNPPREGDAKPLTYAFGDNKSAPALVFSFPLTVTSNASALDDAPVFKFGSEGRSRLSFSTIGKDAVCC